MNLNEKQKLLLNKKKEDLIAYIVEKDNYCLTLENKNKNLLEKISQLEKNADDMDKDFYELKSKVLTLENKNSNLKKENEDFQKLVDEYQNKNAVYLSNLLEENDNNENNEKKFNYIEVKNIQFNYKKIKNDINKRNYDFLCLKLNAQILENLKDKYFNANSNLFFSELINYLDEDKQTTECALFITSEYLYFFNSITFSMGFSIQIDELKTVFISPLNNYVSMTFYEGETINFELFRILDLMNFIKSLNALHK
jgi:vacuolar-type H+-ATPase subunit I/STV1